MNYFVQPQLLINETARKMGIQLIKELNIPKWGDLASFLNVNRSFDGQQATLIWVEHYLCDHVEPVSYEDMRHDFMQCFPESMFSACF